MLEIYFQFFHAAKLTWTLDKTEGFYLHSQQNTFIFIQHLAQHPGCITHTQQTLSCHT